MPGIVAKQFAHGQLHIIKQDVNLLGDDIKCALFTADLVITQATDEYFDAAPFTSYELAEANGYLTGGALLDGKVVGHDDLRVSFDANDPQWTVTDTGFAYRKAVYYDDTPVADKPVLAYQDFDTDVTAAAGTHKIALHADGLLDVAVS